MESWLSAEEIRNSGKYPVVTLELFDKIYDLNLDDEVLEKEQEIKDKYNQYIKELLNMKPGDRRKFLKIIKAIEIRDNQYLEDGNRFLVEYYQESRKVNSIDYLIRHGKESLDTNRLIKAHKILFDGCLNGTNRIYRRLDNTNYVGRIDEDGERIISYFPIDARDIDKATSEFLHFYNSKYFDEHLLLKPQIIHGLIATAQIFEDGNTRLARTLKNVKLYDLTTLEYPYELENPVIYGTSSYFKHRDEYRDLIKDIADRNDDEVWNNWFRFNLKRFDESLMHLKRNKQEYEKVLSR